MPLNSVRHLSAAYKRAKHFAIEFDGPFTALRSPLGNNYARMVYACQDNSIEQLEMLDAFARALNGKAEQCQVISNQELREAFTSFLSLMWFDPARLVH